MSGVGRRYEGGREESREGREPVSPVLGEPLAGLPLGWQHFSNGAREAYVVRMRARQQPGIAGQQELHPLIEQANASPSSPAPAATLQTAQSLGLGDRSGVRAHTGVESAAAADAMGARAFTVGQDVHFASGEYSAGTRDGEELLAHELAHTVQHGPSQVPKGKLVVASPADASEDEADRYASAHVSAMEGGRPGPGSVGPVSVGTGAAVSLKPRKGRPAPTAPHEVDSLLDPPKMRIQVYDAKGKQIAERDTAAVFLNRMKAGDRDWYFVDTFEAVKKDGKWQWTRAGRPWGWDTGEPGIDGKVDEKGRVTFKGTPVSRWASKQGPAAVRIVVRFAEPTEAGGQGMGEAGEGRGRSEAGASGGGASDGQDTTSSAGQEASGSGPGGSGQGAGTTSAASVTGTLGADGPIGKKGQSTAKIVDRMERDFLAEIASSEPVGDQLDDGPVGVGTDGVGDGEGGIGTGRGAGGELGSGQDSGSSHGHRDGEERPTWAPGGRPGSRSKGHLGSDEGFDHGSGGGDERADEDDHGVEGALAWKAVLEFPDDIDVLIAAGAVIADANVTGAGHGWIKKILRLKSGASKVRAAMEAEAQAIARKETGVLVRNLEKLDEWKKLSRADQVRTLTRAEYALRRHHLRMLRGQIDDEVRLVKQRLTKIQDDLKAGEGDSDALKLLEKRAKEDLGAAKTAQEALHDIDPQGAGSFEKLDDVEADMGGRPRRDAAEGAERAADGIDQQNKFVSAHYKTHRQFDGMKVYTRNDLIDPGKVVQGERGMETNLQRMERGVAPYGPDNRSIELHHLNQSNDGPVVEVTYSMHKKNYHVLHINDAHPLSGQKSPVDLPSGIDRPDFDSWKRSYWIARAAGFQPRKP